MFDTDVNIIFSRSAFNHDGTESDIRWAFRTVKYDAILEEGGWSDKHLLIGFDRNANLIEILYNEIDEDTVRVFHAMPCRNCFSKLIKNLGGNYARYD